MTLLADDLFFVIVRYLAIDEYCTSILNTKDTSNWLYLLWLSVVPYLTTYGFPGTLREFPETLGAILKSYGNRQNRIGLTKKILVSSLFAVFH